VQSVPKPQSAPQPRTALPAGVPEPPATTGQLVTVISAGPASTTATLRAWERLPAGGWRATMIPLKVRVGTDGVGKASESGRRTPVGSYTLDQAFGRAVDPGTKLPYRHVGNDDWWVSDTHSASYNTYRHCRIGTCNFDESAGENLGQAGASYDYAMVIGYNTAEPVAGAGSAFFLHVDAGAASAGCVEVPRATVVSLLRWLDPARHPRISITTG
jgi:L,D-peptidoglycan transpeptidase YkuD (ErfK/YbiS/YcfS/YnhG family)